MKKLVIIALMLIAAPVSAEVIAITNGVENLFVSNTGGTITISDHVPLTGGGVAGALMLTGIAASLQSKPIPLEKGTDELCKYPDIAARLENCK